MRFSINWLIWTILLYCASAANCTASQLPPRAAKPGFISVGEKEKVNIFFESLGEGSPIVIVHGGPGLDHSYLRPSLDRLAEVGYLLYYDQRSLGKSEGAPSASSINIKRSLADLEALRKGLGLEKMQLVGHSWGAILAMLYAAKHPSYVRSLVMITPAPPTYEGMLQVEAYLRGRRKGAVDQKLARLAASEAFLLGEREAVNQFMNLWFRPYLSPQSDPDLLHFQLEPATAKHWAQVNQYMIQQLGQYSVLPQAADVKAPTLLIQAEEDVIPSQSYHRLHTNIPAAQHAMVPKSGHFPFLEQPDALFELLIPFLKKHSIP